MTKEELNNKLAFFIDNDEIGITTYAILKGEENHYPKMLDILDDNLAPLRDVFIKSIRENILSNENLSVMPLSSSDERVNVIYEYDLDIPEELSAMDLILQSDDIENFNFTEDEFSKIKALLIEIGNNEQQLVLYKTMASVNFFGRKSFFLKKAEERFEQIEDEFIRISGGFQLMRINESLLVIDLSTIEKFFGFHDIIVKEAELSIEKIDEIDLIENLEALEEMVDDISFARKLTKIAKASPVIQHKIPNPDIINFTQIHPSLKGRIRYNDNGSKILLDTKVSKQLFVQLLNDDFLTSELTKLYYESLAKDGVEEEISDGK